MKREDMRGSCATCRHFLEAGEDVRHGLCVIEPPRASVVGQQGLQGVQPMIMPYWPPVQPEQVCSQFADVIGFIQ